MYRLILLLLLLSSCKTKINWTKECEQRFPRSDSVSVSERTVIDTFEIEKIDTTILEKLVVKNGDTVLIRDTTIVTKPQKIVTKTVFRDSFRVVHHQKDKENLILCASELSAEKENSAKLKAKYNRLFWGIIAFVLLLIIVGFLIRKYIKK